MLNKVFTHKRNARKHQPYTTHKLLDVLIKSLVSFETSPVLLGKCMCAGMYAHTHIYLRAHSWKQRSTKNGNPQIQTHPPTTTTITKPLSLRNTYTHTYRTFRGYSHISPSLFLATHAELPTRSLFLATNLSLIPSVLPATLLAICHAHDTSLPDVIRWGFLWNPFVSLSGWESGTWTFLQASEQLLIWVPYSHMSVSALFT